ncbi:MAG TPA: DnaJ domain-containing protein [Xanthobacteraceae bacterium]
MAAALLGIAALVLLLWALNAFTRTDPKVAARVLKTSAGTGALAGAVILVALGRFGLALPLGLAGLALLGLWPGGMGFGRRARRSPGQISRVRSAFLEMELDHDTGAMRGRILAGRHEGVDLDALDLATLVGLLAEIDEESRQLLATYLDRRNPGWREHAKADAATGTGRTPRTGPMTQEEAYQILGLEPGASAEEIGRAHRTLMKKLHPDQGGSTYLAARINEAKDTLLRRHR